MKNKIKINSANLENEVKATIIEQLTNDWFDHNPGCLEDIAKLSHEFTMFNIKWGTNVTPERVIKNIYEETISSL
jgi:hypothetical protein